MVRWVSKVQDYVLINYLHSAMLYYPYHLDLKVCISLALKLETKNVAFKPCSIKHITERVLKFTFHAAICICICIPIGMEYEGHILPQSDFQLQRIKLHELHKDLKRKHWNEWINEKTDDCTECILSQERKQQMKQDKKHTFKGIAICRKIWIH